MSYKPSLSDTIHGTHFRPCTGCRSPAPADGGVASHFDCTRFVHGDKRVVDQARLVASKMDELLMIRPCIVGDAVPTKLPANFLQHAAYLDQEPS